MKNKNMMALVIPALMFITSQSFADFESPHAGSRKLNKDGDVHVTYDRDRGKAFVPGFELSIRAGTKESPKLRLGGLYFIDAKLDANRSRLAVVQNDGLNLVYGRYVLTNNTWQLEQRVTLVEYNVAFQVNCNRLELENFNTLRACFIREVERSSRIKDLEKGIENVGDKVYLIHITEDGKVLINGKERESVQWHPDLKSIGPSSSTNAPPQK